MGMTENTKHGILDVSKGGEARVMGQQTTTFTRRRFGGDNRVGLCWWNNKSFSFFTRLYCRNSWCNFSNRKKSKFSHPNNCFVLF